MKRARKRRQKKKRGGRRGLQRPTPRTALHALTSGALALPGLSSPASAETPETRIQAEYGFSFYSEDSLPRSKVTDGGERDRYEVEMHQFGARAPIGDRMDVEVDIVYETMSGATPWYVIPDPGGGDPIQVMTGATVEDTRTDVLATGNYYFDSAKASLGGGVSFENDYLSINGSTAGEWSLNENNTTISSGIGFSYDTIEPTDSDIFPLRPEKENKQAYSIFAGISQVISHSAALQSMVTFQHSRGFLSDPYKQALVEATPVADTRPDQRNQFSWLTRVRQHVDLLNGTVHADYQLYVDDWEVSSHTLELAWYQSLWDGLRLVPHARYYTQSQAKFYAPYFEQARGDGFHTSDYRLSPYGALSWGVKAETEFATWALDWRATLAWERYWSSGDLALGEVSVENPGLVSFNLISISLTGRF